MGAAATTNPPTAVPTALAPEATAPIPEATVDPADVTAAPTPPKPIVEATLPIPEAVELIELTNRLGKVAPNSFVDRNGRHYRSL